MLVHQAKDLMRNKRAQVVAKPRSALGRADVSTKVFVAVWEAVCLEGFAAINRGPEGKPRQRADTSVEEPSRLRACNGVFAVSV
eukprot:1607612-Lingulodinium_polyedra.AAC.1